jgi:Ca-activated chloride channel family protein
MEDKKLKELMGGLSVPEPGEEARQAAVKAAMEEFERGPLKGIPRLRRLTGNIFSQGGPVMRNSVLVAGSAAALALLLTFGILPEVAKKTDPARTHALSRTTPAPAGGGAEQEGDVLKSPAPGNEPAMASEGRAELRGPALTYEAQRKAASSGQAATQKPKAVAKAREDAGSPVEQVPAPLKKSAAKGYSLMDMSNEPEVMREGGVRAFRAPSPDFPVPPRPEYVGRDLFEKLTPNPVKLVSEEPVSTFSIDVDTAAYAFVRRNLMGGRLPRKNAVRIEEMINYFDYDYETPNDRSKPFKPTVAVYPTPWNPDTMLLHIGIKGYEASPENRPRSNLVFLIDVSGSMQGPDRLPLLKNSLSMLVETLRPEDTVAIVVYAGAAGAVLEPTKAGDKSRILSALDRLTAGGSTAGGEGIRQAYALAGAGFIKDGINRVILATDGDFNVGITNPEELKGFVERKRAGGIYLSVLGFGQGNYNDALMQKLAQNGNGNAAYIDTLNEARKVLVEEANSTLLPIAKDVKIQVEFNPETVAEYRLIGYETRMLKREDFKNDRVDAGDIGSGHSVTAIYEITPPESKARLVDERRYRKPETAKSGGKGKAVEYAFIKMRYKLPGEEKSRLITTPVDKKAEYSSMEKTPVDVRFAASVAAFGQILRGDPYTGDFTYENVLSLAGPARGTDPYGYRSEFLNLVRLAGTARAMQTR